MGSQTRYIGIKDLFTLINALGGVGAILCALFGRPEWGVVSIAIGFMCGDALDGYVARKTNTANRFGAEFDSASDQLSEGIAPAVVAASYFAQQNALVLGSVVATSICLAAVLRVARFATATFPSGSAYCGLPRVASGVIAAGLPFSEFADRFMSPLAIAAVIVVVASLSLIPIPYGSHKGAKLPWWAKIILVIYFGGSAVMLAIRPQLLPDFLTLGFVVYVLVGWTPVTAKDRQKFRRDYAQFSEELRAK